MIHYLTLGGPVMIPIGIVSIVALTVIIEKSFALVKFRAPTSALLASLFDSIRRRDWARAQAACRASVHPLSDVLEAGLAEAMKDRTDLRSIEEALKIKGDEVIHRFESSIKLLGTMVTVLPLLGFLGTIVGLIAAFQRWESLGAAVTVSELSGGIYQAMITTAAGLILAIPYYLAHSWLVAQTELVALRFSRDATELLSRIHQACFAQDVSEKPEAERIRTARPAEQKLKL